MKNKTLFAFLLFFITIAGCVSLPENKLSLYQRSFVIENRETEEAILKKASLSESFDPAVNNIKVLHMRGTPYEMGFQHGRLLKKEIQEAMHHVLTRVRFYALEDSMDEAYDLMEPYIPVEDKEEMRGLAHGADLPLRMIQWFHAIPEVSEFSGYMKFSKGFKPTSCSNVNAFGKSTPDGSMIQLRVLDWNRQLGIQKWPVILVHQPDKGNASVTFSYAGFIGCVSGMNDKQMAFGEMGYGNPPGESLEGIPFIFLFRKMMREANNIEQAEKIIRSATRTCSYVFLIGDAKEKNPSESAKLFIVTRQSVKSFKENTKLEDEENEMLFPAIDDIVYAGAKDKVLHKTLTEFYGDISLEQLITTSQRVSLEGNMQNVIFKPATLETWVSNAANASEDFEGRACNQKWFYFNLKDQLSGGHGDIGKK